MLECIGEKYKNLLSEDEGPRLTIEENGETKKINILKDDLNNDDESYKKRIESDVKRILKKEGGDGNTHTYDQKELMLWYSYFFLNRGKPTTHISVLSQMTDNELKETAPDVIKKIINKASTMLMTGR